MACVSMAVNPLGFCHHADIAGRPEPSSPCTFAAITIAIYIAPPG